MADTLIENGNISSIESTENNSDETNQEQNEISNNDLCDMFIEDCETINKSNSQLKIEISIDITNTDTVDEKPDVNINSLNNDEIVSNDTTKTKKRPSELELLGAVPMKMDTSGAYDVFGDDNKVYKKYKLRKTEQQISYKEPPNWQPESESSDEEVNSIPTKLHVKTEVHIKTEPLVCQICQEDFETKAAYSNHIRKHTTVEKYKCSICYMEFQTNANLIAHKSTHTDSFLCKLCKMAFSDHCDYLLHETIHSSKSKYTCPECGLVFNKNGYKVHIPRHFYKKAICTICSFETNVYNLKSHMSTHTSKHVCPECGSIFKCITGFKYHMACHTGIKKYQCLYCGKGFINKNQRRIHTRVHTNEKPFHCDICSYKCKQSRDLVQHKTTHETEKKFTCKICNKKFFHKYYMNQHMRSHRLKTKTFKCPECDYSSMSMSGLKTHVLYKHSDERLIECKLCDKWFINNGAFNKHKNSKIHSRNSYGLLLKKGLNK